MSEVFGWHLEYTAWHVTIPMLLKMRKRWAKHPPLQVMIASYLGIGKSDTKRSKMAKKMTGKITNLDLSSMKWEKGR